MKSFGRECRLLRCALAIAFAVVSAAATQVHGGVELLGYYPFEDSYEDASGNGNDAEPVDDPIFSEGLRGVGLEFLPGGPGGGSKVDLPIDGNPDFADAITWGAWAKSNTDTSFDGFMAIDDGGWDRGIFLNRLGPTWGIASGAGPVEEGPEVTIDEWQYVVGTFNDSEDRITLYVGSADATDPTTESQERSDSGDTPGEPTIEIGRYDNQDFDGFVDDAFVFEGELDVFQVNAVRNLRLSSLDYSPLEAAQLFNLFDAGGGTAVVAGTEWAHVSGLDATNPGQVFENGGTFVVLDDGGNGLTAVGGSTPLRAGDADMDLDFDTLDLVQVQIASKYLSGEAATWGEGDWNGAPGGEPGNPPAGDGVFDPLDIIAAISGEIYLTGSYAAIADNGQQGDGQTSVGYDASTGEVWVDSPAGTELTSIHIGSASGVFTGDAAQNLGGSFDNDADDNVFKATFGASFGSISFGNVARPGLAEDFVLSDFTVVGSLQGGGGLGEVELIYVPEPGTCLLLVFGGLFLILLSRRPKRVH